MTSTAKRQRLTGRWRWLLILLAIFLLIPGLQVAMVRFVNPRRTMPMLLEQGGSVFSRKAHPPLHYHWIDLEQMPEMFLKHLWISEGQTHRAEKNPDLRRGGGLAALLRSERARADADAIGPARGGLAESEALESGAPEQSLRREQRILARERVVRFPEGLLR